MLEHTPSSDNEQVVFTTSFCAVTHIYNGMPILLFSVYVKFQTI